MKRSLMIALALLATLGIAGWLRTFTRAEKPRVVASSKVETEYSVESTSPPTPLPTMSASTVIAMAPAPAHVPEVVAPHTEEEEQARHIDELVDTGRIGEAHAEAMDFVQQHPFGELATHVMNLMGVHPRPAGAVPPTPPPDSPGR